MILQKKYYKKVIYKKEEKYEERRGKKEDGRKRLSFTPKGTKLNGRYIIEDVLGEGGFGITYAGRDELLGVKVAVKEYYPQGIVVRNNSVDDVVTVTYAKQKDVFNKGKTKFLEEARVIAKFNDQEGIVNVTDFFEANNTAYIVMEYLDGITLKEYIAENGVLSPEDILELMAPVLESLDEVHKQGIDSPRYQSG